MFLSNFKIDCHRNGVGGYPFFVMIFDFQENSKDEKKRMLAVVYKNDDCQTAVFDLNLLKKEEIYFFKNSWRGDRFDPLLQKAIIIYEQISEKFLLDQKTMKKEIKKIKLSS